MLPIFGTDLGFTPSFESAAEPVIAQPSCYNRIDHNKIPSSSQINGLTK